MPDNNLIITNIQRMCLHDGPGIRTTVFMKGCTVKCPWCANPENISFQMEECEQFQQESKKQPDGIGRRYTVEMVLNEILKDKQYFVKGGVTFSGGEALMQIQQLSPLLQILRDKYHIHLAVETALFVPEEYVEQALRFFDFFYIDVKILDQHMCSEVLGGDSSLYLRNAERIISSGKEVVFRIPCSDSYTFQEDNFKLIKNFLKMNSGIPVEVFRLHELGKSKYVKLGKEPPQKYPVSEENMRRFIDWLIENDIKVNYIKI